MPSNLLSLQQWQNQLLQLETELRHCRCVPSARTKQFEALIHLAQHYYKAQNYRAALAQYQAALKLAPHSHQALVGQGDALRHLNQQALAITSYSQAISLSPPQSSLRAVLYCNRGRAQEHLGNSKAALKDYARSLRLDPSHAKLWQRRGHLLYRQERYGGALISYAQAQFRQPQSCQSHNAADFAERSLFITSPGPYVKRYGEAFEESDRRLSRSLSDGEAWQMQAQQLKQLGFKVEAQASAVRAIQLGLAPLLVRPPVLQA